MDTPFIAGTEKHKNPDVL